MKCPNCGNEVRGNFCTNCGTRMDQVQTSPPSEVDSGDTAVIRPGDLTNLAERESAAQPPPRAPEADSGATAVLRPEDLQALGQGAQPPPPGQSTGPEAAPPYVGPGGVPGAQQPYGGQAGPADQQPYGAPGMAPGAQQPYGAPGSQPGVQQPYGAGPGFGAGQQPYGGPAPTGGPQPSGGNWARELGVGQQSGYGGSMGGPIGGVQRLNYPGGMSIAVPPGLQQALAPLEVVGKQVLAWIGCALVFIGLFLHSKTLTVNFGVASASGSGNFWDWAPFWGTIILILVLVSAGLAFLRDYKWLLITGALLLLILIFQFLYTFSTGVSYSGVSARPSYAWILLFPGALAILAASVMRPNPRDNPDDQGVERLLGGLRGGTGPR